MRRTLLLTALLASVCSGCEMMQWLAPHNLWKLNRQPPIGGEDGYFSIPPQASGMPQSALSPGVSRSSLATHDSRELK